MIFIVYVYVTVTILHYVIYDIYVNMIFPLFLLFEYVNTYTVTVKHKTKTSTVSP